MSTPGILHIYKEKKMKRSLITVLLIIAASVFSHAQITNTIFVQDSVLRLYNATQYTANDVVTDSLSKVWIFNDVVTTKGFGGIINSAILTADSTTVTTNGNFKLMIYNDTIVTAADNAAWATSNYYNNRFVGEIDFALTNNGTTNNYSMVNGNLVTFQTASKHKKLYGILLAKAAYTPARGQKFIIKLGIVRN